MKYNGIGHKTRENIVVHIVNMLNGERKYRVKGEKTHIYHDGRFIPLDEYHEKFTPKLKNPLR